MAAERFPDDEPCYVISVVSKLVDLHPQTLRYYDRVGLITPSRTAGRVRLYSQRDVETLRKIVRLTVDLGVNLAGVEVIMNMSSSIEELQAEIEQLKAEHAIRITALRQRIKELEGSVQSSGTGHPVINVSAREVPSRPEREES